MAFNTYKTSDPAGTLIGRIFPKTMGSTLAISPADSKVAITGSDATGWKLVVGAGPLVKGSTDYYLLETLSGSATDIVADKGAWTASTAYAVNDVVTQSSNRYVCVIANNDATFTASKWVQIGATGRPKVSAFKVECVQGPVTLQSLTLSASSFSVGAAAGTLIGNINGKTAGSTLSIAPADGKVVLAGDDTNGWKLNVGLTAATSGTLNYTITETLAGAVGSPRSSSVSVVVQGVSQLLMTNRLNGMGYNQYGFSNGTDTDSNLRISAFNQTGAGVSKLKMMFVNWTATVTNETAGLNPITVTASLEYPAGTFQQIKFGGSASKTLQIDDTIFSDELVLAQTIPDQAQFWIWTYVSVSAGQKWPQGYLIRSTTQENSDFSTGVDKTMTGNITVPASGVNRRGYGPVGVVATGFVGTPVNRAWASMGDSLLMGVGDSYVDSYGSNGWPARALLNKYPYVNFAVNGTFARDNYQASQLTRRLTALQMLGVTDILVNYANNDLAAGGGDITNLQTRISSYLSVLKTYGFKVHYCTVTPYTTGTFKTAAGQTINTVGGGWVGGATSPAAVTSDWIRTKPTGVDSVFDMSDVVSVDANNNKTRNGGYWGSGNAGVGDFMTGNTRLTTTGAATDAASVDGRHPSNSTLSAPFYGGHYMLRDAFITYLDSL